MGRRVSDHANPRWLSTAGPPPSDDDLKTFPALTWEPTSECWRAHGHRSPWYFSSAPGRFNLFEPRGTLNTASDAKTAVREYLGVALCGQSEIPSAFVDGRRVSKLRVTRRELADLTADAATAAGVVTGDFSGPSTAGYTTFRFWAEAFDDAGFGGVFSRSRFGTGLSSACIYLFGSAGEHPAGSIEREVPLEDVLRTLGPYKIVRPKDSGSLSFEA